MVQYYKIMNDKLINNSFYWIKLEHNWEIGNYYDGLFQITTGEFIGMKRIIEIDYNPITR